MKNNITELVFILDRSGSMAGLEQDTVGGFNAMLERQKRQEGDCYVSTVLFNTQSQVLHDRIPLAQVPPMTDSDYQVGGCTALLDALGSSIHHIGLIHRYARPEDVPEHTVFVITTDGMENASHHYSSDQVKEMISRQEMEHGWEFLFIAANIDAVETGEKFGIRRDRAVNYHADSQGTEVLYETVSEAVSAVRRTMPVAANWSRRIDEDYRSRKKNN